MNTTKITDTDSEERAASALEDAGLGTTRCGGLRRPLPKEACWRRAGSSLSPAVLARYNEGVDANCAPMFDRADGLEALEVFIDRLAQHVKEPVYGSSGCPIVATMSEGGGEAEAVDTRINYYRAHIEEAMTAALDPAEKAGSILPGNAGERAAILFAIYIGAQVTARVDPDSASTMVQGMKSVLAGWTPA